MAVVPLGVGCDDGGAAVADCGMLAGHGVGDHSYPSAVGEHGGEPAHLLHQLIGQ